MNDRIAPLVNMAMLRRYKTLFTCFNRIWVFFVMQISIGEDINESGIVINNPLSLLQNPFIPVWSLSGCHALLYSCKRSVDCGGFGLSDAGFELSATIFNPVERPYRIKCSRVFPY